MKSLVVILFIAAVISFVSGVFACCGKIKNKTIKNSGVWLIITGALKTLCGLIAVSDPAFAVACLVGGLTAISAVVNLLRDKGDARK
ncbi:MAG: hypothetical protein IJ264_01195 [Clostridia bacterium]|nr:hypothetical protein [Clostridia bacterium]